MHFKPEGNGVDLELIRRLRGLSLESCKDVAEYTRKFRVVDFDLKFLHSDVAMPEPYLILLYLIGLGHAYRTFVTAYTKAIIFSVTIRSLLPKSRWP